MSYIISNQGKSGDINIELLKLSVVNNLDKGIFEVITHQDGRTAILVDDLDINILIHPLADTARLKELVSFDDETKEHLDAVIELLKSQVDLNEPEPASGYRLSRIAFRSLVEGNIDIHDYQYMVDDGWFG